MSTANRTCILTGTTHGIGLETAKLIAGQGAKLIMLNRNTKRATLVQDHIRKVTGNHQVFNLHCDLASLDSVRECAHAVCEAHGTIDVLINNAGIMNGKPELSDDGVELTFAVNYLGPFLLTQLLVDSLLQSPRGRVVNLASNIHVIGKLDTDNLNSTQHYKSMRAYARSKLANVMHTIQLADKYRNTNMTANCLHPGVVATNLLPPSRPVLRWAGKLVKKAMRTPAKSAETAAYLALSPDLNGISGKYFSPDRNVVEPSNLAKSLSARQQLWETSMQLVGLT